MKNILENIAQQKRVEVDAQKQLLSMDAIDSLAQLAPRATLSLRDAIKAAPWGIIAEHKRRSPSKGEIQQTIDAGDIVRRYRDAGAAASSVLTDTPYFGGSLIDLAVARNAVGETYPLLRKDFTVDRYQIAQARLAGADAILLIAAILSPEEVKDFTRYAHSLEMQVLLEMHSPEEIGHYFPEIDVVGVNNRDLRRFVTDLDISRQLASLLPAEAVKISESGIRGANEMRELAALGYDGFLIGETFMASPNPPEALKSLLNELNTKQ